ncbi:hypothetical protein BDY21DRAFT_138328 [Lineolata rhizophorae]|uniref:Uncharacterized protein n=1 Tax=Lineolata rhizophorae TaxID=578093 RepID=A0A6A6PAW0_9PEZI|nr:hypothetical protein BDY21DRAFT_138328 [Lineolata rhizophorae]
MEAYVETHKKEVMVKTGSCFPLFCSTDDRKLVGEIQSESFANAFGPNPLAAVSEEGRERISKRNKVRELSGVWGHPAERLWSVPRARAPPPSGRLPRSVLGSANGGSRAATSNCPTRTCLPSAVVGIPPRRARVFQLPLTHRPSPPTSAWAHFWRADRPVTSCSLSFCTA